ncbi:hypothetical protein J8273_1105 [Carpediemonas membranifera]|nr:hypothetical protein J8273_1105 [Carpediemonas membranifera]|eukprot:KAG9397196.1 hypothetical protein J8273_1105 [Carpediemonas membranifera]
MLVREAAKGTQEAYQRIEQTLSTHDYTVGLTQVNPTSDFDYPLDFEVISGREIPAPPDPNHGNKKRKVKLCLLKDQIGRIEADIEIINENVHMLRENIWRSFDRTPSPAKRTNKLFAPGIVDETVVTGPLNGEKDLRREHNLRTHVANRALRGQAEAFIAVLGLYGVNRWEMPPLIERYVKPSKSKKRSNYKERQDKCRHETAVWEEENTQLAVQDAMLRRMLSEMRSALEKTVGGASHAVRPVELAQSQQQSAPPLLSDAISWNPAVIGRLGIR